ncbi:DUF6507 family protein [Streptomyces alboflavus]|uniref:DUF6507 family protein n=1 Tax=Streptomyces alboflavus TaxID=67267 RepID=UPI00068F4E93|nr:DUF6507 family protein [Streptomyces alboflavus]
MPKWDVTPAGVGLVASQMGEVLGAMSKIVTAYGEDMGGAAMASGTVAEGGASVKGGAGGGLVAAALAEFAQGTAAEVQFIPARAAKSVDGALLATAAYEAGDMEMATRAQRHAAGVDEPDMAHGWTRGDL